jgi:hypothetical protein
MFFVRHIFIHAFTASISVQFKQVNETWSKNFSSTSFVTDLESGSDFDTYLPTYLPTYLLAPWCRRLFEKLIVT